MPINVYLAGPVFSMGERRFNEHLAEELVLLRNTTVFLPQSIDIRSTAADVFGSCIKHIDECSYMVAMIDGPDADSGTAFEMGYAYATKKPIIGVRTDFRAAGDAGIGNIMLIKGAVKVIECYERFFDIKRLAKEIHDEIHLFLEV